MIHDPLAASMDGVRDPFRWGRFRQSRFLAIGALLVLLVIMLSGKTAEGNAAKQGHLSASRVASSAVRLTVAMSETGLYWRAP